MGHYDNLYEEDRIESSKKNKEEEKALNRLELKLTKLLGVDMSKSKNQKLFLKLLEKWK